MLPLTGEVTKAQWQPREQKVREHFTLNAEKKGVSCTVCKADHSWLWEHVLHFGASEEKTRRVSGRRTFTSVR